MALGEGQVSPKPLNEFCVSTEHVRSATHMIDLSLEGIEVQIGVCTECRERLPEIEGEMIEHHDNVRYVEDFTVLGYCGHGVNLDTHFCPEGCRV